MGRVPGLVIYNSREVIEMSERSDLSKHLDSQFMSLADRGWSVKDFSDAKIEEGFSDLESAMSIYEKHGDKRLDSVMWRLLDGVGDALQHMIEVGQHEGRSFSTGKGYTLTMNEVRFEQAMKNRKGVK